MSDHRSEARSAVPIIYDPAMMWLAVQLHWERRLEELRLQNAVEASPRPEEKRPAA
jgi:hypothetical protein